MPKKSKKKSKSSKKKGKKFQIKFKKPKIKFKKPSWEEIKKSKVTKYSLLVLLVLLFFVAIDFGVQYLNNDYSAAVVNGDRVTDREYYYRLDQSYGSAIVTQLIEEELIRQEAQKQGIEATQEEIDEEMSEVIEQIGGQDQLDLALETYGLTKDDLERQIEIDILTRKILEPTLDYTEEDVMAFFEEYSDMIFPEEAQALEEGELLSYEDHKAETLDVFLDQEIESAKSDWLADLKADARIQNNVTEDPKYRFLGATRNIVTNLWEQINSNEGEEIEE
jgi:foldase protein PrsA